MPSDDYDFSRRDFSSTTAFQLACDNHHVIRVKDMGNKSGKKNQWTVADVKKAIKQKNEQSENSYVQDKVDLKGVRSPSAVDTNDVEAVETTYLAAVETSRVPSNQAGDITAEDEEYSDDNVTGNVDNNIALAEHLKKRASAYKDRKGKNSSMIEKYVTNSNIFQPYRAVGLVSSDIPFAVNENAGSQTFLAIAVDRSFNIYRADDLTLAISSSQLEKKIQEIAVWHDLTFCVCMSSRKIIVFKRANIFRILDGKHNTNISKLYVFGDLLMSISKENLVVMWMLSRNKGYSVEYLDKFSLIQNNMDLPIDDERLLDNGLTSNAINITVILHPSTYLNKILLASDCGQLHLWNIRSKKCIYRFKQFVGRDITTVVQSPAIDVVGIGCRNGRIFVHNLKYDEVLMKFKHGDGGITSLAFRNDTFSVNRAGTDDTKNTNSILAAGSTTGSISLWNLETQSLHSEIKRQQTDSIVKLHFLQNEPLLLSTSIDNSLKMFIFDRPDGTCRLLRSRIGHAKPPTKVRFYGGILSENNGKAVDGSALQLLSGGQDCSFRSFHATRDSQSRN